MGSVKSSVEPDDAAFGDMDSTAPTTPDGSGSSSPVLRAEHYVDIVGFERPDLPQIMMSAVQDMARPVRNICCVGAGYVGGPTAAVIAYQNPHLRVTVVDKNEQRIRRWNSKHLPIYEPGLGDIVRIARDGSRACFLPPKETDDSNITNNSINDSGASVPARQPNLFFSTQVARCIREADIVLIAVNTPTKTRGTGAGSATDMTSFEAVTSEVAQHARPGTIIVEKSTVPCRTAELVQKTMAVHRPGVHFEVLSNPEFLAAGTAMKDIMHPDRVLIGSSTTLSGRRAAEALVGVYAAWVPRSRIITTNVYSSELSKLVANSMLAQRISSINSISAICERTGADVDEIAAAIGCDPRIGDKFLKAGIGFGGSCFKKDILSLVYLAESLDLDEVGEYWRQVVKMNEYQRDRFAKRVIKCLNNTLVGKKITLLGYAFKANTSDTRESPALEIIKTLLEESPKEIAIYDPCCNPVVVRAEIKALLKGQAALKEDGGAIEVYSNAYTACSSSHAVLITTEFDEFRNIPSKAPSKAPARAIAALQAAKKVDPRPSLYKPSETDILDLQKFLLRTAPAAMYPDSDPLQRYKPEPPCESDCPDCELIKTSGYSTAGNSSEDRKKEQLDWSKISYHMNKPKWLFDGKGIIDAKAMGKLGIRVESVGRVSA
ncbi:nucleotide sugar dehydrogenase [Durotheca rogersii]|uniref:nucleotide sugar dehydrogenase n=1 Tax=Durotheca rogersii TaxID=419775 RepID=UPI00221FAC03|nr:nucleotide sugar dehydrogenase [Durotheca rogersii]KAI5856742.1 nucleotide sugar dehydrogenase [Durotheca rogersii]